MHSTFDPLALSKDTYRFIAIDVETASFNSASICQIGMACVAFDGTISTHSTYIDPEVSFAEGNTRLHGIDAETVRDAPTFSEVLPLLKPLLEAHPLVQHSRFDEKAFDSACKHAELPILRSFWIDSVSIARSAWPELRGNGGHGLGHLKQVLGLQFRHHDAGEDARAAAEVVLLAEAAMGRKISMLPTFKQLSFDF